MCSHTCSLLLGVTKAGANFHNANSLASMEADFWEKGFQTQRGLSVSCGNSFCLKHVTHNHAIDSFVFPLKTKFISMSPCGLPRSHKGKIIFLNKHTDSQEKKILHFVNI